MLLFAVGLLADVLSEDNYKEGESVYIDLQDESFEPNVAATTPVISKSSTSSANLNYDAKHHNTVFLFRRTSQKTKGYKLGSKVGLFILYSSLKISPVA